MTRKRITALAVLGLFLLALIAAGLLLVLIRLWPEWYQPRSLDQQELLAAEQQMIHTVAEFNNASQVDAPFILELTDPQLNDMLAVLVERNGIIPDHIGHPLIRLAKGHILAGALVTWKGQTSVVSIRISPFIDSAGLLHIKLDRLRAGALTLPESFLPDTLEQLERAISARLATSKSRTDKARTARKNKDFLARVFSALAGAPVTTDFVTREDLRMTIEDIRIMPDLLEIQFRPLPVETSAE